MKPCPILTALTSLADISRPLYVACSGGRDSLALAYGCVLLYRQGKLPTLPTLLHVHHGMQAVNDDWAKFVASWANEQGFAYQILSLTLDKKSETTARQARYHALASAMSDDGVLLVAHHSDDQAETVLMRLIHGAGVQGLSGMRAWQVRTVGDRELTIHRPLLTVSRANITAFAHAHALPYVDDPTNDGDDNARNLIRNQILPSLASINPKVAHNIARTATLMDEAHALISQTTFELFKRCVGISLHTPFVSCLNLTSVREHLPHEQSAVVRYFVQGGQALPPTYQVVYDTLHLIARTDGDHNTRIFWQYDEEQNGALTICRYQDALYRYHHGLFLLLQDNTPDDKLTLGNDEKITLKSNGQFALYFYHHQGLQALFKDKSAHIKPLTPSDVLAVYEPYKDKQGGTQIGFIKLHGKKLYQHLRIPTWQRQNLWVIYAHDDPVLLMSMDKFWLINGVMFDELAVALAHERMGQTLLVVESLK